jgi:hypothetical protein
MTPKEFVEDDEYQNAPLRDRKKDIQIFSSPSEEWLVLSYYYSPELGCLVLDITSKKDLDDEKRSGL